MQMLPFVFTIKFFYCKNRKSICEIALATDWRKILGVLNLINDAIISNVTAIKANDINL